MNADRLPPSLLTQTPRGAEPERLSSASAARSGTIAGVVAAVMARKSVVLLTILIFMGLAALGTHLMRPIYRASTSLLIEPPKSRVGSVEELFTVGVETREHFQTQIEYLKSRDVVRRVIDEQNLSEHPLFDPRQQSSWWRRIAGGTSPEAEEGASAAAPAPTSPSAAPAPASAPTATPAPSAPAAGPTPAAPPAPLAAGEAAGEAAGSGDRPSLLATLEALWRRLRAAEPGPMSEVAIRDATILAVQSHLSVQPLRQSKLVEVAFEAPDPNLAADIANSFAESYIRADLDARFRVTQASNAWMNDRLASLRERLEASERRQRELRDEFDLLDSTDRSLNAPTRQLEELSRQIVEARMERAQAEQVYAQVRPGSRNRYNVPLVLNNPGVARAREQVMDAERKLADAERRLGSAHPMFLSASAELRSARDSFVRQAESVIQGVQKNYEVALATERSLEQQEVRLREKMQEISAKETELGVLERELSTNRQLYQMFLTRARESGATQDFLAPVARIVDPAIVPAVPVKPQRALALLLAGVLGALLGAVLAVNLERRTRVIRSTDDVEAMLDVPLITSVPRITDARHELARLQVQDAQSHFAEAVRTAVTGARLALLEVKHPVVAFSSTVAEEGKTTLAINFAIEAARTRRVLLIDSDFRRPSVARKLGLPPGAPGFGNHLAGEPLQACLMEIPDLGITVLPAGKALPHALDVLLNDRFVAVLDQVRGSFDVIVLDTPPVELVSDALLLARECDGVIFVARSAATPVAMIQRGLARLASAGARVIGVVLNAHDFVRARRYYEETSANAYYTYERPRERRAVS